MEIRERPKFTSGGPDVFRGTTFFTTHQEDWDLWPVVWEGTRPRNLFTTSEDFDFNFCSDHNFNLLRNVFTGHWTVGHSFIIIEKHI